MSILWEQYRKRMMLGSGDSNRVKNHPTLIMRNSACILFDKLDVNEGMIMENIVAQMLRRNGHKLYFYSRSDSKNRENHMEIDFLITENKKIAPIEVKSAKLGTITLISITNQYDT